MAAPVFAAAGTGAVSSAPTINIGYPSGIASGHLLITHVRCESAQTISTPTGWTKLFGPTNTGNANYYLFAKSADGTESGSQAFTASGGTATMSGRMYRFTGWLNDATMANNFEGSATSGPTTSNTIADAGVTTAGTDRLVCNFVGVDDDNALDAFTGQTGGTWAEAVAEFTTSTGNPDSAYGLQTETLASAGTINGGTDVMAASDPWVVFGLAILPSGDAPATIVKDLIMSGMIPFAR